MLRCPVSLERLIRVTGQGTVIYLAEKRSCRRFPRPASPDLFNGVARNVQVFDPLDFIAALTQHIPDPRKYLVRYFGFYSNKEPRQARQDRPRRAARTAGHPVPIGRRSPPTMARPDQTCLAGRSTSMPRLRGHDENHQLHGPDTARGHPEDPHPLRARRRAPAGPAADAAVRGRPQRRNDAGRQALANQSGTPAS